MRPGEGEGVADQGRPEVAELADDLGDVVALAPAVLAVLLAGRGGVDVAAPEPVGEAVEQLGDVVDELAVGEPLGVGDVAVPLDGRPPDREDRVDLLIDMIRQRWRYRSWWTFVRGSVVAGAGPVGPGPARLLVRTPSIVPESGAVKVDWAVDRRRTASQSPVGESPRSLRIDCVRPLSAAASPIVDSGPGPVEDAGLDRRASPKRRSWSICSSHSGSPRRVEAGAVVGRGVGPVGVGLDHRDPVGERGMGRVARPASTARSRSRIASRSGSGRRSQKARKVA